MKPVDVNINNQHVALNALYGRTEQIWMTRPKAMFKVGDDVQISKMKHTFAKGYEANWSYEIFTIIKVIARNPPLYKIKDYNGTEIDGKFYAEELQKVHKPKESYWQIEKILKTRKKHGKTEHLVKWKHYPKEMNSWVSDITSI